MATHAGRVVAGSVVFVSLAALCEPALVLPAIARALGIPDPGSPGVTSSLVAVLRHQQHLLVLDNFEHVVASAPELHRTAGGLSRR